MSRNRGKLLIVEHTFRQRVSINRSMRTVAQFQPHVSEILIIQKTRHSRSAICDGHGLLAAASISPSTHSQRTGGPWPLVRTPMPLYSVRIINGAACSDACGKLERWPSQWLPLGTAALGSSQDVAEPTTLLAERESGAMLVI